MSSSDDVSYFHWLDYVVFVASLSVSLIIGVYYAIKDRKSRSNEDFLMAGRSMGIGPMTASMFATLVPSIGYIMLPVEVYYFGFGFLFNGIGACLGAIPIAQVVAPAFQRMKIISAFQYLEDRFNSSIRKMASVIQILLMFVVMGANIYAPAVAFAQVSGVSIWTGIIVSTSVCTIYTTLGGMKAVMWSDAVQVLFMFAGISLIAFKAIADLGGFKPAFEIMYEGGRINQFTWTLDPFIRSSVWTYLIGAFFACFVPLSSNQMAIQRYCTMRTEQQARCGVYLMIPMYFLLSLLFLLTGLAMYAHFAACDPLASGKIQTVDQMVPYLAMMVLGPWPGLPGLFIACIFAASLSTVSSGQNALAAVVVTDLIEPIYLTRQGRHLSATSSFIVAKVIALQTGGMVLVVASLIYLMGGNLFQLFHKFAGILVGPVGGLFTIAVLIKSISDVRVLLEDDLFKVKQHLATCPCLFQAVMSGFVVGAVAGLVVAIGSEVFPAVPDILPIGTECYVINSTSTYANISALAETVVAPDQPTGMVKVFQLSPLYYLLLGYGLTVGISVLVDLVIKRCRTEKHPITTETDADSTEGHNLLINTESEKNCQDTTKMKMGSK